MPKTPRGWVVTVRMAEPSLQNNTADTERVLAGLKPALQSESVAIDLALLRELPALIRQAGTRLDCILCRQGSHWTLIGVRPGNDPTPIAGLAVDLGTSRVVLRLVDLRTGNTLAENSFDNPQISIGPDILTRIHHADQPAGQTELMNLIIDGLNRETARLCETCGIKPAQIFLSAVAGNTAMTHLFMGLEPKWIIREPYIPVINRPGLVPAAALGLALNPRARVFIFPNIGSYFGGDLIAGILYSGIHRQVETTLLVDVGTNAEVVLGNRNWLIACAGAAGPALEGGVTRMGMMAGPGVIERVALAPESGQFQIRTIENLPPVGICGSGLIDLAACLFLSGMLDIRGKLVPAKCGQRLKKADGLNHFVVVSGENSGTGTDLSISQVDLDSLVRSKAAMYTILETISESVGMALKELSTFFVAGTFGSFINPHSAISIGMLPDLPIDTFRSLGNSSLGGATRFLTTPGDLEEIDRIRDSITYLELNVNQDFMNRFSAAKFLPHTNTGLFPSVVREME